MGFPWQLFPLPACVKGSTPLKSLPAFFFFLFLLLLSANGCRSEECRSTDTRYDPQHDPGLMEDYLNKNPFGSFFQKCATLTSNILSAITHPYCVWAGGEGGGVD